MSTMRKLYDLTGADTSLRFSPYCWRAKLAMAHKGLTYETVPWRFTDKDEIAFAGTTKVPVLVDGEKVVHDSQDIAEYLESSYSNGPTLLGNATARGMIKFVKNWTELTLHPAIARLVVPDIHALLLAKDQEYFRRTREAVFGETIEAMAARREQYLPAFHAALVPLRATLKAQPFISGTGPAYADHIVFGALEWGRQTSRQPLLEADDIISVWMKAVLETYGL